MKKIYSILCMFIAVSAMVSCSNDDDEIVLSTLNSINSFEINFEGLTADDVTYDLGNNITISVPFKTSLSALIATIGVDAKATVSPASGESVDYTDGQAMKFTVTAEDAVTVKTYNVTINVRGEVGSGSRLETYIFADAWGENSTTTFKYSESNFVNEIAQEVNDWGDITTTTYILVYDDKNQVIEKKSSDPQVSTVYAYNEKGQIATSTYNENDVLVYSYTYTYDATSENLLSESRVTASDSSVGEIVYEYDDANNVTKETRYNQVYEATYDDKNNPFKGIYPVAFSKINTGIRIVNTNNPISYTSADAEITYTYNTDNYPLTSAYTYFDGAATVGQTFTYYAE